MYRIVILLCIVVCASSFVIFPLPNQKSSTGTTGNTYPQIRTQEIDQDAQVTNINVKLENGAQFITPALDLLPPKEIPVQQMLSQNGEDKVQTFSDTKVDTTRTSKNIALPQTDLLPPKFETEAFQIQTATGKSFESVTPTEKIQLKNDDDIKPLTVDSSRQTDVTTALSPNNQNTDSDKQVQSDNSEIQTSKGIKQTQLVTESIMEKLKESNVNINPLPIIETVFETDLSETEVQPTESTTTESTIPVTVTEIFTTEQPKEVFEFQDTYNEETSSQYNDKVTVITPDDSYYATPESVENVVKITPPAKQVQQKDSLIDNGKVDENKIPLTSISEPEITTSAIKTKGSDLSELPNEEITTQFSEREGKSSGVISKNPSSVTVTTEVNNFAEPITLSLDLLPPEVINAELREPKTIELEELPKIDLLPIDLLPPKVDE